MIVDFAAARGKRVRLRSAKRPGKVGKKLGSKPYVGEIMEFRRLAAQFYTWPEGDLPRWAKEAAPPLE